LNKTGKSCFDQQLRTCSGAFMGFEDAETYNPRVQEAIEALQRFPAFPDDMLIIDKGRTPEEKAIVRIEEGLFRGFGFCREEEAQCTEDMLGVVKAYPHNKDVVFIIKDFLKKNPKLQILRMDDQQLLSAASYLSGFEG